MGISKFSFGRRGFRSLRNCEVGGLKRRLIGDAGAAGACVRRRRRRLSYNNPLWRLSGGDCLLASVRFPEKTDPEGGDLGAFGREGHRLDLGVGLIQLFAK